MAKGAKVSMGSDLLKGLTKKGAAGVDRSMSCKGGSVNDSPTRDSVAPTPKSLGTREA